MELPNLTSDLDFAHSICGDAADYFEPLDPVDIATKISGFVKDSVRREKLISQGRERLKSFPTAKQRADMYLDLCRSKAISPANSTS